MLKQILDVNLPGGSIQTIFAIPGNAAAPLGNGAYMLFGFDVHDAALFTADDGHLIGLVRHGHQT